MAKLQGKYESVIIISTKLSEEEIKAMVAKFTDLISANGTLGSLPELMKLTGWAAPGSKKCLPKRF